MIQIRALRQRWRAGLPLVLDIPEFDVDAGEHVFLAGSSGSGKSTLLAVLAGVLAIDEGDAVVLGAGLASLRAAARDRLRAEQLGVIFQLFNLLPYLTAIENVGLAGQFAPLRRARAGSDAAQRLLDTLRLPRSAWQRPARELSVGQQQRVAAARALYGGPRLVLADEPTSALDRDVARELVTLLQTECRATDATLLFVGHDRGMSERFDRTVELAEINHAQPHRDA